MNPDILVDALAVFVLLAAFAVVKWSRKWLNQITSLNNQVGGLESQIRILKETVRSREQDLNILKEVSEHRCSEFEARRADQAVENDRLRRYIASLQREIQSLKRVDQHQMNVRHDANVPREPQPPSEPPPSVFQRLERDDIWDAGPWDTDPS